MERKRLFSVVVRLVIAAGVVAGIGTFGLSQTPEKMDATPTSSEDSLRQVRRAKLKELAHARKDTITGWLIVDGEYIPGPYEVVVVQQDSSILVNGIVATAPAPQPQPTAIDPKYIAQEELRKERNAGFDSVYTEKGEGAAKRWVFEFLQNHPLVDTVYASELADLAVRYVGDEYEDHITFSPPEEKPPTREEMEEMFKKNLQRRGDGLRGSLSHGSLVIKSSISWGGMTIPYPDSKLKMDELIRITSTIPDMGERVAAIRKIIGNNNHTRLIAERFKVVQAEVEK